MNPGRYIVIEGISDTLRCVNSFRVNDISEWVEGEKEGVIIIDTVDNKIMNSFTCEWEELESF